MSTIDQKKKFIINSVYIALICLLFYLLAKYAFGILMPFAFAFVIAAILQKPVNTICKKGKGRGLVSTILVLLTFSLIFSILAIGVVKSSTYIIPFFKDMATKIYSLSSSLDTLQNSMESHLNFLPNSVKLVLSESLTKKIEDIAGSGNIQETLTENIPDLTNLLTGPISGLWNTAKKLPSTFVAIIVSIISCCFLTADFKNVSRIFLSLFKKETADKLVKAKEITFSTLKKLIKAYGFILLFTFAELCIGFLVFSFIGIFKISNLAYIPLIAIIIAVIDIIPILGTGTVLIPSSVISFILGNNRLAAALIVLYLIITIVRQIIEPKLVAANLNIPPFITILSMYIGSQFFGVLGIFLMPVTVTVLKALNDEHVINITRHNDDELKPIDAFLKEEFIEKFKEKEPEPPHINVIRSDKRKIEEKLITYKDFLERKAKKEEEDKHDN